MPHRRNNGSEKIYEKGPPLDTFTNTTKSITS
jgi:hypothetical protein